MSSTAPEPIYQVVLLQYRDYVQAVIGLRAALKWGIPAAVDMVVRATHNPRTPIPHTGTAPALASVLKVLGEHSWSYELVPVCVERPAWTRRAAAS